MASGERKVTIPIEIERDWVRIAGQTVYRPENIVPGDWLEAFDKLNGETAEEAYLRGYEEGFAEGMEDGD